MGVGWCVCCSLVIFSRAVRSVLCFLHHSFFFFVVVVRDVQYMLSVCSDVHAVLEGVR